ncbi:hypothetical protein BKA83DRAFT_4570112 [Pisolithus microcarpus]|nr:hypothetical protein BKA83DRAFT_4570112 [Pisolithus microcarpus]
MQHGLHAPLPPQDWGPDQEYGSPNLLVAVGSWSCGPYWKWKKKCSWAAEDHKALTSGARKWAGMGGLHGKKKKRGLSGAEDDEVDKEVGIDEGSEMAGPTLPPTKAGTTPSASTSAAGSAKISQGSSRLYDIAALTDDGSNYQMWKFRMEKVLSVQGLWNVVAGSETQAPNPTSHPV